MDGVTTRPKASGPTSPGSCANAVVHSCHALFTDAVVGDKSAGCYNFTQLIDSSLNPVLTNLAILYFPYWNRVSGIQPTFQYNKVRHSTFLPPVGCRASNQCNLSLGAP
jgi:hypothetical protein